MAERYAAAALKSACDAVSASLKDSRNNTLNSEAYSIGQLVGADLISYSEAETALVNAAKTAGIEKHEAVATVASGLKGGMKSPRDVVEKSQTQPPKKKRTTSEAAAQIYREAKSAAGTLAARYLREARSITGPIPSSFRFHETVWHKEAKQTLPAMIAPITNLDRSLTRVNAVHITFLDSRTAEKASIQPGKKMFGTAKGGAVWLREFATHMLCAEGIEKGLACQHATNIPTAVGLSSTLLPSIVWPRGTQKVTLCADPNGAGEHSIARAAEAWAKDGIELFVCYPPTPGQDWDECAEAHVRQAIAKAKKWTAPPQQEQEPPHTDEIPHQGKPPVERPLTLIPWDEIRLSSGPRYLVRKLVPMEGLIVVYGPPKCGKTFWLFDLLMHVALGWDYRDLRVQRGGVIYCLFEGQAHFAARVEAFRQQHLSEQADSIPFYLMPVKLELVKDHQRLIDCVKSKSNGTPPRVVVLDTLNRSFTGSESSDEAMTAYVSACDAIRDALGCAVVIVHHSGLDAGRYRGHTSLLGAADAQISVKRDAIANVVATVEYMKDGPDGQEIVSKLETVEVGFDDEGETISSCVVVAAEGMPELKSAPRRNRRDKTFDEAFCEISFSDAFDHHVNRDGPLVKAVLLDQVEREFKRRYVCEKGDEKQQTANRKKQWQYAIDAALSKRGYAAEVTKDARQLVWKTGTGMNGNEREYSRSVPRS